MEILEGIATFISYLPVFDVLSHGFASANTGSNALNSLATGYDVGQLILGLHIIAKGFKKLSEATPWEGDDKFAKRFVGFTTTLLEIVSKYMGADTTSEKK